MITRRNLIAIILCLITATMACGQAVQELAANNHSASSPRIALKMKGKINHERWEKGQTAEVEFSRIPQNIEEFKELQSTLGKEPQGAVALQIMAFEMFHRDQEMGSKALELNNTPTNLNSTKRQLKEVFRDGDSYARPYLAAALLAGATAENAYTPSKPYRVSMRVDPVTKYQYSSDYDGEVIYLQVDSKGWDQNWRAVQVIKPADSDYYVVFNCPALYIQCKKIRGKWQGLD